LLNFDTMFENKDNRTEIGELGEFGLINHIAKNIQLKNKSSLKGIGDDAAVINNHNLSTVISTDMLVEGVHFDLTYTPLRHLGYKAVVVNLSDIYAMNARPKQITTSIALSNRFSLEAVEELYSGITMACEKYGIDLIGGDTTSSKSGLVISVTAIGEAKEEEIVYRDGAKETDLICVSGDLGGAYMGLQILEREKRIYIENPGIQPDLGGKDYILERQLKPEARKEIIDKFEVLKVKPTSMIDISDGLSSEVLHICTSSGVGCNIYEDKFPIDHSTYETARELHLDPSVCALNGGEDYELLFTIKLSDYNLIKDHLDISIIGHITDKSEGINLIDKSGNVVPLVAQGWNALKSAE
jgi:thiamine-monophosphate kinase